jgi:hypothetical protein
MRLLKVLIGVVAAGAVVMAFRDFAGGRWLRPSLPGAVLGDAEEPVLGYDGMDRDTLIDWLGDARLDDDTLRRIRRYEEANGRREPVLAAVDDLLA